MSVRSKRDARTFRTHRYGFVVIAACACLLTAVAAQTASPSQGAAKASAQPAQAEARSQTLALTFVRKISSAQDVKHGGHPGLERAVEIIAGPKEETAAPADVLETPTAVTTDPTHRLFVADPVKHGIHIFDFDQSKYFFIEGKNEKLEQPFGLASGPGGDIYVSDVRLGLILIYDPHGKFRGYLGKRKQESYFEAPMGIAINPATGRIYVCDAGRDMVIELDRKGRIVTHFGKRGGGTGAAEFKRPTQVATNGDALVVLDAGNQRLQIMDMHGHFRNEIKLPEVDKRAGLAVDREGNIYVAQTFLNSVQVFDRNGQPIYRLGKIGTDAGEFQEPFGLTVNSRDGLYVADSGNHRVQQFRINPSGRK